MNKKNELLKKQDKSLDDNKEIKKNQKLQLHTLINQLINDVDSVEKSDIPQGQKTAKYKALATKFKNALFNDRRKFRGRGLDNRITLKTYSNYLSRTRKLFDNKLHHSFTNELTKLIKKYEIYEYANLFNSWLNEDPAQIRIQLLELQKKLKNGLILIDKYKPNSKNTALIKSYPEWSKSIKNGTLINDVKIGEDLLNDLSKIKVNHEIMYHLTMDQHERAAIKIKSDENLKNKKRNTVTIDYQQYLNAIYDILSRPDVTFYDEHRKTIAPLAFALAAVSGRRMIEIILTGQFKKIGKYKILFSGQVKKRTENENFEREIYTLIDSNLFIKKIKLLRSLPALQNIDGLISDNIIDGRLIRNDKIIINSVFSRYLNDFTKNFFNDERRVFKDSRSIYARIVYEKYFKFDSRWANVDEDVFFAEILGHDDDETQLHYKQFKLENFDPKYIPIEQENKRLIALQSLDDDMPSLARFDAAVKIHNWVKSQVAENPDANITTYSIRKNLTAKPTTVAKYLQHVANALQLTKNPENGRLIRENDNFNIIVTGKTNIPVDDHNDDIELAKTEVDDVAECQETEEQPQFTAQQLINKSWLVQYTYQGQGYVWTGDADNIGDAINRAWKKHK